MHVVLAAGGTAGHIYPAINTAIAIQEINPEVKITILGTQRGLDRELVPPTGFDLKLVDSAPFPRKINGQAIQFPFQLFGAVKETKKFFTREKVTCVVGFGGYASAPAYLAARSLGICMIVHEANSTPGMANRLGAKLTKNIALNHKGVLPNGRLIGMPISREIRQLNRHALRDSARKYFGLPEKGPVLLVFGGSQGAVSLNQAVVSAVPQLLSQGINVLHAVGPRNLIEQEFENTNIDDPSLGVYRPVAFIDRMDLAYAAADLSISRAGAMTVAEVTAVKIPSIFIPLPIGNGEQEKNAKQLVAAGAALICPPHLFTQEWIGTHVSPLITDPETLKSMSERSLHAGISDAARDLAQWALACDGG